MMLVMVVTVWSFLCWMATMAQVLVITVRRQTGKENLRKEGSNTWWDKKIFYICGERKKIINSQGFGKCMVKFGADNFGPLDSFALQFYSVLFFHFHPFFLIYGRKEIKLGVGSIDATKSKKSITWFTNLESSKKTIDRFRVTTIAVFSSDILKIYNYCTENWTFIPWKGNNKISLIKFDTLL